MQPPQIVNPVLGGQDVRNVAGNQMDIRNADPRDIRISNGYVTSTNVENTHWNLNICVFNVTFLSFLNQSTLQHSDGASTRSNQRLTS